MDTKIIAGNRPEDAAGVRGLPPALLHLPTAQFMAHSRLLSMMDEKSIVIFAFEDAPKELQDLSDNGGDEDWIAVIPPKFQDRIPSWLDEGSSFGICCVDAHRHPLLPGYEIRIGCHS